MKQLITFLLISFSGLTQNLDTSAIITSSEVGVHFMEKAGSCVSPDGTIQVITSPPGNYQYLEDNGYCHVGIPTTNTVTMCFTFTPTTSSVSLNAGFSESCFNNTFTAFNLYNSSCGFVSSSFNPTGLVIGQTYTWCVTMRAWGGFFCSGYETFCPYWIPVSGLPSEVVDFSGSCGKVSWTTLSEYNNDKYVIEKSIDGLNWRVEAELKSNNSSTGGFYTAEIKSEGKYYYRLVSYDFDGYVKNVKMIYIDCDHEVSQKVYDMSGRFIGNSVPQNGGIYIIKDSNGNIKKY